MGISGRDVSKAGWEPGAAFDAALASARRARDEGFSKKDIVARLEAVWRHPDGHLEDDLLAEAARLLSAERELADKDEDTSSREDDDGLMTSPVPCSMWGREGLDEETLRQMDAACRLPVAVAGAQMPDGHVGYGLPIGGVLAVHNAVIPYGVGVDIGCRMKLSIVDVPASRLDGWKHKLKNSLVKETCFGVGGGFRGQEKRQHAVMDDPDWDALPRQLQGLFPKDKAWGQLGTSGSGNHFVEFGELEVSGGDLGIPAGTYIALLSHSGSRGFGANVASYYTNIAMEKTALGRAHRRLAWLDLRSNAGQEYWLAMSLAGQFAAANHDIIHRHVLASAGLKPLLQIENHHNFAWKEMWHGEEVIVHRKGATPAHSGVLGIIPGSMADPGYVVRGLGNAKSINSAAHGAGRRMSRKKAMETLTFSAVKQYLEEKGVELISAGLDEAPMAYKNIGEVMAAQRDLVEPLAEFRPKLVLMARGGKAED